MKKVPTWRVILGSVVITTGMVASYSFRAGVETADAAPLHAHGSAAHGDAGVGSGSAMGSDAGSGAGSATHAHKPVKHAADSPGPDDIRNGNTAVPTPVQPPITPPPSDTPRNATPVPPGSPGPTGPITPGATPISPGDTTVPPASTPGGATGSIPTTPGAPATR